MLNNFLISLQTYDCFLHALKERVLNQHEKKNLLRNTVFLGIFIYNVCCTIT